MLPCFECGSTNAVLTNGRQIYPHRLDLAEKQFYLCKYGAYVGCHPNSTDPLGGCAGAETRKARIAAHAAFDPIWKSGRMTRGAAYRWLSHKTGIPKTNCHIGMMTIAQAKAVVSALSAPQAPETSDG